jgi:hypothetical protein
MHRTLLRHEHRTHIFVDGSLERLREAHVHQDGQPNSFLLGTNAVVRYYCMFDECLKAAAERPLTPMDIKALSQSTNFPGDPTGNRCHAGEIHAAKPQPLFCGTAPLPSPE